MSSNIVPNTRPIVEDTSFREDDLVQITAHLDVAAPAKTVLTYSDLTPAMFATERVAAQAQAAEQRARALVSEARNNVRILDEQIEALREQKAQAERELRDLIDDMSTARELSHSATIAAEEIGKLIDSL